MSAGLHPLLERLHSLGARPCNLARKWIEKLPLDTTPAQAWEACHDSDWRDWLRDEARDNFGDSAWQLFAAEIPGFTPSPPNDPEHERVPVRSPAHETRCFFARVAGSVLKVVVRCVRCDGGGCSLCYRGRIKVEALHPADTWTLAALKRIAS